MRPAALLLVLAAFVALAYTPAPSPAPVAARPSASADTVRWENLQVLPDTLSREELIDTMRGYAQALGVRCTFCHVREGEEMVFASDAKPNKLIARDMIRMTAAINDELLQANAALEAHNAAHAAHGEAVTVRVTCWTCHRGEHHPATAAPPEEPGD